MWVTDLGIDLLHVPTIERERANQECKQDDTDGPNVDSLSIALVIDDLRAHVKWWSALQLEIRTGFNDTGEAKVGQLTDYITSPIFIRRKLYHDILQLEITMDQTSFMDVADSV